MYLSFLYYFFGNRVEVPTCAWDILASPRWLDPPYRTKIPARVISPSDFHRCDTLLKTYDIHSKSIRLRTNFYIVPLDNMHPNWRFYPLMTQSASGLNATLIKESLILKWPPFYLRAVDGTMRLTIESSNLQPHCYFTEGFSTENFEFGDPIVVCEGIADAESLGQVYPYVVSSMTASISPDIASLLSMLTNIVVICYDNDDAGERGSKRAKRTLDKAGVSSRIIKLPEVLKDAGELLFEKAHLAPHLNKIIRAQIEGAVV